MVYADGSPAACTVILRASSPPRIDGRPPMSLEAFIERHRKAFE
jgi:hypothetical protein